MGASQLDSGAESIMEERRWRGEYSGDTADRVQYSFQLMIGGLATADRIDHAGSRVVWCGWPATERRRSMWPWPLPLPAVSGQGLRCLYCTGAPEKDRPWLCRVACVHRPCLDLYCTNEMPCERTVCVRGGCIDWPDDNFFKKNHFISLVIKKCTLRSFYNLFNLFTKFE